MDLETQFNILYARGNSTLLCSNQSESDEKYETFGLYVTDNGRGFTRKSRTIVETTMT
jgi:nitrogen fixation/metabolism regulation signal transduction histidine kinase